MASANRKFPSVLTNLEHVRRFAAYIIHHRLAQVLECQFGDIDVSIEAGPEDNCECHSGGDRHWRYWTVFQK